MTSARRRLWTPGEDEQLRLLVSYWGDQCGRNSHWDKISSHFPERSAKDCRKRWFHSLDPTLKRGRWTPSEDQTLVEAHRRLGPAWQRIAQLIPGRTDDQCAKRYSDVLDPNVQNRLRSWTPEEDSRLMELVQLHGSKWQQIAKDLEGRTGLTCRNRWRKLQSGSKQSQPDSQDTGSGAEEPHTSTESPGVVTGVQSSELLDLEKPHQGAAPYQLRGQFHEQLGALPQYHPSETTYTITLNPAEPHVETGEMHPSINDVNFDRLFDLAKRHNRQVVIHQHIYGPNVPTGYQAAEEENTANRLAATPPGTSQKLHQPPPDEIGGPQILFDMEREALQRMIEEEQQLQAIADPLDYMGFNPS